LAKKAAWEAAYAHGGAAAAAAAAAGGGGGGGDDDDDMEGEDGEAGRCHTSLLVSGRGNLGDLGQQGHS